MTKTDTAHIWLDDEGRAWIDDSNIKVIEVALDRIAWGWSAEEIYHQLGGYLTMAQIHAALAYYYDHQDEFDREIEKQAKEVDALRAAQDPNSPVLRKLRASGRLT